MHKFKPWQIIISIFWLAIVSFCIFNLNAVYHTGTVNDNRSFNEIVTYSVTLTVMIMLLVYFIFMKYTFSPMRSLNEIVRNQIDDQLEGSNFVSYRTAIRILCTSFNQMATQLNTQITEMMSERGKLTAVLANMTDGIIIVDRFGFIQLINPAAQHMFSVSETEALSHPMIEVVRHHQLIELVEQSQTSDRQKSITLETSLDRLFMQAIATPLRRAIPGSTLVVLQDLTRLRKLEMVRRDFVSNVSHELRTPLASLKALTETLDAGALEDPPAARRFLSHMDNEIDNLTQIVQELLELSKIESKRAPLKLEATSPYELLYQPVERMQLQAERAGISLKLDCSVDLPEVFADPLRMQQVIINLLHNAIKFTPAGGEIIASATQETSIIIFSIQDSGVGISADDLPRIFERFYKADRARSGGGTGLGLSIARHLVEAHGGRIWVESQPKKGSTFNFSIPMTKSP